jgi:hypothetical protein
MNQFSHFYRRNGKNCKKPGPLPASSALTWQKPLKFSWEDSQVGSILAKVSTEYWQ